MSIRVLVCGGRTYNNKDIVYKVLDLINSKYSISVCIEGGAKGADQLASRWATEKNIPIIEINADWETYGKAAGHIRNKQMIVEGLPDLVVAFPGGKGTENMIKQSKASKIKTIILNK